MQHWYYAQAQSICSGQYVPVFSIRFILSEYSCKSTCHLIRKDNQKLPLETQTNKIIYIFAVIIHNLSPSELQGLFEEEKKKQFYSLSSSLLFITAGKSLAKDQGVLKSILTLTLHAKPNCTVAEVITSHNHQTELN